MPFFSKLLLCAALLAAVAASACSGDDGDTDETPEASGTVRATSTARPVQTERASADQTPGTTPEPTDTPAPGTTPPRPAPTQPPSSSAPPPPPPPPPAPVGRVWTLGEAQALLASAPLTPSDLAGAWTISIDTSTDNAAAAAQGLNSLASLEACGRLSGRTVANLSAPEEVVGRYLGGQAVSFFTNLTVYATEKGANDCSLEAATNAIANPSLIVNAFASVFVDPAAVVVAGISYPPVGDASVAWTLKGKTDANGNVVDLTILVVAFRKGNVSAVVGSAAASTPSTTELSPHVNTVLARITAAQ